MERLVEERMSSMAMALEPGTMDTYQSALRSFINFTDLHQLLWHPTANTLSLYVVWACGSGIEPRSISSYLSGICSLLEPFYPDVKKERASFLVVRTLTGCHKRFSAPTSRKRPLTQDDLYKLQGYYHTQEYEDILFWTITTVGWHGLHRLGELVCKSQNVRNTRKTIKRSSLCLSPSFAQYVLPYHKADRFYEGNICIIERRNTSLCPVAALERYISARDKLWPHNENLFVKANGQPPTRSWYMGRLRKIFSQEVAGHSLRSGGATHLALQGVAEHTIRTLGRWSSDAFDSYIRENPVIVHARTQGRSLF